MAERTNEQQWVQIRDILDIVGENGMSGDETDEEACSPPFYFHVKTVRKKHIKWISEGLSALFYAVDSFPNVDCTFWVFDIVAAEFGVDGAGMFQPDGVDPPTEDDFISFWLAMMVLLASSLLTAYVMFA